MAGRKGEKIWADAVRRAVMRRLEDIEGQPKKLECIADRMVDSALEGKMDAIKEIGDRLDGKARQESEVTLDTSDPIKKLLESVASTGKRITDAD